MILKKNVLAAFVGLVAFAPTVWAEGKSIHSPGDPNHPEFNAPQEYKSELLLLLLGYRDEKVARDKVMERIQAHPEELNDMISEHCMTLTPLSIAFYLNDEEMVALMLEKGAIPFPSARNYYWGADIEKDPKYAKVFSLIREAQDKHHVFHRIRESWGAAQR